MKKDTSTPVHTWLVMMKAMQAITCYGLATLEKTGLGLSDLPFLRPASQGTAAVNVMGPKVNNVRIDERGG